jgi:VWFA-related protein
MRRRSRLIVLVALAGLSVVLASWTTFAQQRQTPPTEDVVRVNAELVQTDAMVFAKDGTFVDGLKREQFELKVDGQLRHIQFFERISAGSRNEEAQLAAARGTGSSSSVARGGVVPLDRGRTVFFYVDDIHLSPSSMSQARSLLRNYVNREMGQNDEAAITSASGQMGFLEQLTDNRTVLRTAVERLNSRGPLVLGGGRPAMSEYQALLVDRNDSDVLDFYIDALIRDNPDLPRQIAGDMVRQRASQMLQQSAHFTSGSLASLERVVRLAGQLPGRKILLLISDGFFLDNRNSDSISRMRKITSAAARAGVVIYSIDARGLLAMMPDLGGGTFDPTSRLQRASFGELEASRDGLNALARDTGGRAFINTNAISEAVTTALQETSVYYLVAWRPEIEELRSDKPRRVEVKIIGRPDLSVRLRRSFGQSEISDTATGNKNPGTVTARTATEELRLALGAPYQKNGLPISLALHFLNLATPGTVLAAAMKIRADAETFSVINGKPTALIDIAGIVFDDNGKPVRAFHDQLTISATSGEVQVAPHENFIYNYRATLKPGIYQLRVAARDQKTGQLGSAMRWIEMPDLAGRQLALSSIIAGERPAVGRADRATLISKSSDDNDQDDAFAGVRPNVERRFARTSLLRFLVFTYNAAILDPPTGTESPALEKRTIPDLAVQLQVLRDNQPVITSPLRRIAVASAVDLSRLPYLAEIPLETLPAGHYLLKVTVIDRIAKTSASQQLGFQVD